jgi:IclR family acetate operon transcriptional repressor
VERDAQGGYRIGLALLPLQAQQLELLAQRASSHLELLRDELHETTNLGILDGTKITYLAILESHKTMRMAARRGDRDLLHSTALGKAIAAQLSHDRVAEIIEAEGMTRETENTITQSEDLFEELERVRRRGYAVDDLENEPDGRCVAAPLLGIGLPAAISVSAPASRLQRDRVEAVGLRLIDAARALVEDMNGKTIDGVDGRPPLDTSN